MKVSVAIPHYNSLAMLWKLLAQLREDSFDQIVVLDDASSDRPTKLETEFPTVTFIYGSQNIGAGNNRNRALEAIDEGIVWFIDTDMEIVSEDNADRLRHIFRHNQNQMIGGLIYSKSGQEMDWNYGHEMHPVHDARFEELMACAEVGDKTAWLRLKKYGWDYSWLHPSMGQPKERRVDWVAEGSFALPIELFRSIGGYDPAFRFHEGQDLARRIRQTGASITIRPDIISRHLESKVRKHRDQEFESARYLFFKKYWNMSQAVYDALYKN